MTDITQCPQCGTHFKITHAQREAHQGLVRCGRCQNIFNAVDNLYIPPQQLDLPLVLDDIADFSGSHSEYNPFSAYETMDSPVSISPQAAARMSNDFSHIPDVYVAPKPRPLTPEQKRLLLIGSAVFALTLLLQLIYFFRVDIAAKLPGLKPAMLQTCVLLNCTLPLPQKIDLISIESSELEADPEQANIITLHALLRSRAPYAMSYPSIELTLTDTQDNAVARRSFGPPEYLSSTDEVAHGFAANRESTIKLHLDTTDLKPAGYRLFLFYPQ
jgi:predicted Zn finger-like uncharacterized protein